MKSKIQIVIAVIVMLGAAYWGYSATRSYRYSGANIMFPVGGGHAIVQNTGDQPLEIEMRSGERVASFRVVSADLGLNSTSKRQGTGRTAFHNIIFDIPPGQTRIDVASGSDIRMIARGETRIEATVVPVSASTRQWILILVGGIILWALYYISSVTKHRWISDLRHRMPGGRLQPKHTTT